MEQIVNARPARPVLLAISLVLSCLTVVVLVGGASQQEIKNRSRNTLDIDLNDAAEVRSFLGWEKALDDAS